MQQHREFDEIMQEWQAVCADVEAPPAKPNRALLTTILDKGGKLRQVAVFYNSDDNWFDYGAWSNMEEIHRDVIELMQRDKTILGFQTEAYIIKQGGELKHFTSFQPSEIR